MHSQQEYDVMIAGFLISDVGKLMRTPDNLIFLERLVFVRKVAQESGRPYFLRHQMLLRRYVYGHQNPCEGSDINSN